MGFQGLKRLPDCIYFSAFDKQGHNPTGMCWDMPLLSHWLP